MGLDFYVVAMRKDHIKYFDDGEKRYWCKEDLELAYGRKSWELVHTLGCPVYDPCAGDLTLDAWIDLQEKLANIGPWLEEIRTAFEAEDKQYDTPRYKDLRDKYYEWYDNSFPDETPQLGYDFSVGYMITFWEAADEVLKYLEDPDWEVWMLASY